jgi:sarcosine oxidase subunit beta
MTDSSVRVAVIGGGAIGTSTLFHLAERHDVTDAILFEKDQLGSGSTSKAAGGVRNTFSSPMNIEMGNRNIEFFEQFESRVGQELTFRQTGYTYLFHSEDHENRWREYAAFYTDHDVAAEVLSPTETQELFAPLNESSFRGALHAPDCGHVDPHTVTQAFGRAAVERGATVHTKTAVTDVTVEGGGVSTLETEDDTYEVDAVLNAAGPWASRIGDWIGVNIPIDLLVRRIMVTSAVEAANSPLFIDKERKCYFKTEANGSMLICDTAQDIHDVKDSDSAVSSTVGYDYYLRTTEKVERIVPTLGNLDVINGWAGLQSHTPDGHAVVGSTDVDDFYLACGFSGHGVQQSPSVGAAMADLIVEGDTDIFDVSKLSLDRFESSDGIEPEGLA